jgi:hypothetical protein
MKSRATGVRAPHISARRYKCDQRIDSKDGLDVETPVQGGSTTELQSWKAKSTAATDT